MRAYLFLAAASVCLAQESTPDRPIEAQHWKRARVLVERRLHDSPDCANAVFLWSRILFALEADLEIIGGDTKKAAVIAQHIVSIDAPEGYPAEARAKLALAVSAQARARQNSATIGGAK